MRKTPAAGGTSATKGRQMTRRVALFAILLFSSAIRLWCQQASSVIGTVVDGYGAAVEDATFIVTNEETGRARKVVTSKTGQYSLSEFRVGICTAEAIKSRFDSEVSHHIKLELSSNFVF